MSTTTAGTLLTAQAIFTNNGLSLANVNNNRWNRYRIWKPLGLLVLASVTPPQWDITVIDENLGTVDYASMPRPDVVGITAFTAQATINIADDDEWLTLAYKAGCRGLAARHVKYASKNRAGFSIPFKSLS